jgi:UDP-N-acetylglucosamine 2-epimerase (non-hydrolysing)
MKVSVVFGTRPEAIKLASVIHALRSDRDFQLHVCVTAQHREMLDQVLSVFDIIPDLDLDLMREEQSLSELTSRSLLALDNYFKDQKPDLVLCQGDTTTVLACALAAFYRGVPVGHVEAGLRTWNMQSPWPEEANRVLTSRIAAIHFAPTENSRSNLLAEGILPERIVVTGNTVIDALLLAVEKVRNAPPQIHGIDQTLVSDANRPAIVLITGHRRESFGLKLENICKAVADLANQFPEVQFIYPVHLNPAVRHGVMKVLGSGEGNGARKNVHLIGPLPYFQFVSLLDRSTVILTDSGGIQEEAPSLGKPVLVTRETTERPEGLTCNCSVLVGSDRQRIVAEVSRLLLDRDYYKSLTTSQNPYGDGKSSARIVTAIRESFILKKDTFARSCTHPEPKENQEQSRYADSASTPNLVY